MKKEDNSAVWWLVIILLVIVIGFSAYFVRWKVIYDNHVWLQEHPGGTIGNAGTGELYEDKWPD